MSEKGEREWGVSEMGEREWGVCKRSERALGVSKKGGRVGREWKGRESLGYMRGE